MRIDLFFLNETSVEDKDEPEVKRQTALDAATLNQHIATCLAIKGPYDESPYFEYSRFDFGDTMSLFIRNQIDSKLGNDKILIRSLLDNDFKGLNYEWSQKLDNQRGAILVKELTNNNALFCRWILQAILSNSDTLKLSFAMRTPGSSKRESRFSIIGIEDYAPQDLANQIGLNVFNGYGIIKALAEKIHSLPAFENYVIMKDPNRPQIRIYGSDEKV